MSSSSSIIIGGQDLNTWVQKLLQNESAQIDQSTNVQVSQLKNTQSTITTSLSEYGTLQNLLNTLQQNITALNTAFNPSYTISSSTPGVATATTSGSVAPGTHTVNVTQLAQAESVASGTQTTSSSLGMVETLNFTVGSTNFNVNVASGDGLQDIANNINTAAKNNSVSLNATVQQTGTGQYQLVVASSQTGTANSFNITETVTTGAGINVSTPGAGSHLGTVLTNAQNAQFTLDTGMSFNVSSNTNTIEGMNIALAGTGTTTLSVTATNPVSNAITAIQNVYTAYNNIMTNIAQAQGSSAVPDTTLSSIQTTLQSIMNSASSKLATYGISLNTSPSTINITLADGQTPGTVTPTGLMSIDTNSADFQNLTTALTNNFAAVQATLVGAANGSNPGGIFTQIGNDLTTSTGSIWKSLNDQSTPPGGTLPNGAIPSAQKQLGNLNSQIQQAQNNAAQLKQNLILKYAELDMTLSTMQGTSNVLTAELQAMNGKTGG